MGQLHLAHAGYLDPRFDYHLASKTFSHQRDLRALIFCFRILTKLDHWTSLAGGGGSNNGTDVSTLRLFYGDRSQDHGEVENLAMYCGLSCCFHGNALAAQPGCVRAVVRLVYRWTNRDADRHMVGVAPCDQRSSHTGHVRTSVFFWSTAPCHHFPTLSSTFKDLRTLKSADKAAHSKKGFGSNLVALLVELLF